MDKVQITIKDVINRRFQAYRPPPRLTVDEWAERERHLSQEASAEHGPWHNDRAPHLVEIMRALSPHDACHRVVAKLPSQCGKTEVGLNFVGYVADQDPGPMLAVQPTLRPMGEAFAKDRVFPMIRDTPALTKVFGRTQTKTSTGTTILHKPYPGGHLTIGGANSPSQLASRPIRYFYGDEIDRWTVTKEGSPLLLARKRMTTFWNRKELLTSSPTFENVGIDKEYKQSLQHERQLVCMHCGETQFPHFKNFVFDRNDFGKAQNVRYMCQECGGLHGDKHQNGMKTGAQWVVVNEADPGVKGFWMNQFASPFVSWADSINEFLEAKDDPELLQVVVNTVFAECWHGVGEKLRPEELYDRREVYPMKGDILLVPPEASLLFLLVDTQDTWLDYEVLAANADQQSWAMERGQLYGNTDEAEVWEQLDDLIDREFPTAAGTTMPIYATMIDIKGHRQGTVVQYVYERRLQKVFGYAGLSSGAKDQISRTKKKLEDGTKRKINIYNVRADDFKLRSMRFLNRDKHEVGACHWPMMKDKSDVAGYDNEHFEQLCSEELNVTYRAGVQVKTFKQTRPRNEAFDHRHMFYALLQVTKPRWHREERKAPALPIAPRKPAIVDAAEKPQTRRQPTRSNDGWLAKGTRRRSEGWIRR